MNKKILYFIYETFSVVYLFFYYSIVYTFIICHLHTNLIKTKNVLKTFFKYLKIK